jgi:phosphohistidine phosphatase SixA
MLRKGNRSLRKRALFSPLLLPALSAIAAILVIGWLWNATETTTVILVRHAEKMSEPVDDPGLSSPGTVRARALAGWLEDSGIEHIYVSQYLRTKETAIPIAETTGAFVHELPAADIDGLVDILRTDHRGQTMLVIGHSNTVPEIVRGLGGELSDIDESDYSRLIIVTGSGLGRVRVTSLRYGG